MMTQRYTPKTLPPSQIPGGRDTTRHVCLGLSLVRFPIAVAPIDVMRMRTSSSCVFSQLYVRACVSMGFCVCVYDDVFFPVYYYY